MNHTTLPAWIQDSKLVQHWIAIKHEVELHKWYESERAGHDIGWERAYVDWKVRYGEGRFQGP